MELMTAENKASELRVTETWITETLTMEKEVSVPTTDERIMYYSGTRKKAGDKVLFALPCGRALSFPAPPITSLKSGCSTITPTISSETRVTKPGIRSLPKRWKTIPAFASKIPWDRDGSPGM